MSAGLDSLRRWMDSKEDEHLEFKEAKNSYEFEELVKYCVALANEGGGWMVLGGTNKPPRKVVGSRAFENLERTKSGLIERLHLRIGIREFEEALPGLTRGQIHSLLRSLRGEGKIRLVGEKRGSIWERV